MKKEIDALLSAGDARDARAKLQEFRSKTEQRHDPELDLAWSYRKEAQCDFLENRLEAARDHAMTAAEYARLAKDPAEQADAHNSLGIIYGQKGSLKEAVEQFEQSYELHEAGRSGRGASVLNNIGRIYEIMGEHERALEYFQNALSTLRKNEQNPHLEGVMLGNVGITLSRLQRHEDAVAMLHESISVFEANSFEVPRAHALAKLADALVARKDQRGSETRTDAERLYREAIESNAARSERSWHEELQGKLGCLLVEEGRHEEARPLLESALEGIAEERISADSESEWRSRYSEVLEQAGDAAAALHQQRLAYAALDRSYKRKLENRLHEALAVVELRRLESENQDLAHKAQHDPLTALLNRRAFEMRLREEIARARRYRRDLSLAMLDLDYFKTVNDTIGHIGGDQVLIATAQLLNSHSRVSDVIARYGGEEFVLILPETTVEQARRHCEKLRTGIERLHWGSFGITEAITASIGISGLRQDDTLESLLDRADTLLYRSKQAGRNRVAAEDNG